MESFSRCESYSGFSCYQYSGGANCYNYVPSDSDKCSSGGNIRNQSNVTASFLINPAGPPITTTTTSNFVVTQVNTAQLNIQKSSSVQQAALGETYTYSVVIRNNGTVTATNVSFIDPIALETTFVANSVTINGTYNLDLTQM